LHLAKKKKPQIHIGKVCDVEQLTLVNRIIKYDLQLKCMLVRCGRPVSHSRLIVPVLSIFFIRVFSPLPFHVFPENILFKRVVP